MNRTLKKVISITLSVVMATGTAGACAGSAYAQEKADIPDNTNYLVQIEDSQEYKKLSSKYKDKASKKAGILMIASAGNDAGAGVQYPAAYDEVIAVGSIDNNGVVSDFSAVGNEIELVAPGEDIAATGFFDEVVSTQGTSVATAHVTGLASLLWDKDVTKSAGFIRALLNDSAKYLGYDTKYGSGVIDADFALKNYDAFAENYKETSSVKNTQLLNNTDAVDTYTDNQVKALWWQSDHMDAIDQKNYAND